MARSQVRVWLSLLVLALCALPASAEVFHVTLNNGSVIDTAYQPQKASWDPNMVLLLAETGNWIGFQKDEIESIRAEDPTQGFGVRISDKRISLGISPNDLPAPGASGSRQDELNERNLELVERALALAEKQQTYSIQQGVSTENTQGIPASFGGSYFGGGNSFNGGGLVGGVGGLGGTTTGTGTDTLTPGTVIPPDTTPPNP
jgi:hypothetical protein